MFPVLVLLSLCSRAIVPRLLLLPAPCWDFRQDFQCQFTCTRLQHTIKDSQSKVDINGEQSLCFSSSCNLYLSTQTLDAACEKLSVQKSSNRSLRRQPEFVLKMYASMSSHACGKAWRLMALVLLDFTLRILCYGMNSDEDDIPPLLTQLILAGHCTCQTSTVFECARCLKSQDTAIDLANVST